MTISLKDFRESAGLRQEDVAQAVGVHQSSVSKAERGKATPMVAIKISAWTNGLVPSWTMAKGAVGG